MKKRNNRIAWTGLALVALVFLSCEKEIPYEGDQEKPVLVINAIVECDSVFQVELTRSQFILEELQDEDLWITEDASLKLTDLTTGAVSVQTVPNNKNWYKFPDTVKAGHSYQIEVSHPDFVTATARMTAPQKISINSVQLKNVTIGQAPFIEASLIWNDPADENFYFIRAFLHDTVQKQRYEMDFYCSDPAFVGDGGEAPEEDIMNRIVYCSDETFNGQSKTFKIRYDAYFGTLNNTVVRYELLNAEESVYRYQLSLFRTNQNNGGALSEPVKVFNNIENGLGIMGGFNRFIK